MYRVLPSRRPSPLRKVQWHRRCNMWRCTPWVHVCVHACEHMDTTCGISWNKLCDGCICVYVWQEYPCIISSHNSPPCDDKSWLNGRPCPCRTTGSSNQLPDVVHPPLFSDLIDDGSPAQSQHIMITQCSPSPLCYSSLLWFHGQLLIDVGRETLEVVTNTTKTTLTHCHIINLGLRQSCSILLVTYQLWNWHQPEFDEALVLVKPNSHLMLKISFLNQRGVDIITQQINEVVLITKDHISSMSVHIVATSRTIGDSYIPCETLVG